MPAVAPDAGGIGQPLQRVGAGGPGRPIAVALVIVSLLATVVWQPWGGGRGSPAAPATPAAVVADGASTPPAPSRAPARTPAATIEQRPRPTLPPAPGPVGVDTAVSLLDDEWTVVAFLARDAPVPPDEPWISNGTGAARAPGGSLLVRQQQLSYTLAPMERPNLPDAACRSLGGYQHPAAAHLPSEPVVFLGVTFPGMSSRARVSVVALERTGIALRRLPALIVPTMDAQGAGRYTVPASGAGGAVLFALAPQGLLPPATYRFEIRVPGLGGPRYLYACLGPGATGAPA